MANDEPVDGEILLDEPVEVADPWRDRAEVLALLLVVGAVGLIGQYAFTALYYNDVVGLGDGTTSKWQLVLPVLAQGGSITSGLLVASALVLVVFVPGAIGGRGRLVLNAVSVVGVLVATLALLGVEEALRAKARSVDSGFAPGGSNGEGYLKVAAVFVWVPSFAVAGFSAFTAWRTLNEIAPPPAPALDDPDELTDLPLVPLDPEPDPDAR